MMMRLTEAASVLSARCSADTVFSSVGTDSRRIPVGALFVALRGENFDGHDFVQAAAASGASAALVDSAWAGTQAACGIPLLVVADTRIALGRLAANWRARFEIPLIGITGSNGKTTVKEMCAAILRAQADLLGKSADTVLATTGNLNNDIGLPLTLLALRETHEAAVIEMGMNHPGEIAYLADIARPTVAIVTNAQRAHLQGMGTVTEIAHEKGAIFGGLPDDGVAVINADDPHANYWRGLNAKRTCVTFGLDPAANVSGRHELHGFGGQLELNAHGTVLAIALQVPGEHNACNALAATAACLATGHVALEAVVEGLTGYSGTRGRLQSGPGVNGATIIDDSYNANPDSVRAAIDVLAATPGRKILVLGDMGEIGRTSAQVHDEIGGYAKSKGIDALYALGDMSAVAARNFGEGGHHFRTLHSLINALQPCLSPDTAVLVKGSRFMRMERVADALSAVHNADPSSGGNTHVA